MAAAGLDMRTAHADGVTRSSMFQAKASTELINQMTNLLLSVKSSSRKEMAHQAKPGDQSAKGHTSQDHNDSHNSKNEKGPNAKSPGASHGDVMEQALRSQIRRDALIRAIEAACPPGRSGRCMPCPEMLIPMRSEEGLELLEGSVGQIEEMVACFQGQGPLQCAVTSLTVALNFLSDPREPKFRIHELQDEVRSALRIHEPFFPVQLGELAALSKRYASTKLTYASDSSAEKFRQLAVEALEEGGAVIVNFSRSAVGYASHFAGHCSPLGAYNPIKDQFLVLDVAMRTWQSCWVPTELLFHGMKTVDEPRDASVRASRTRGFLILHSYDKQTHL
jgi:hypothetical protein